MFGTQLIHSKMKQTTTLFLVLCPFAFASLSQLERVYFPEENNPEFKRHIYIENDEGGYELVDLGADEDTKIQTRASISDVEFDLYTRSNKKIPCVIKNADVSALKKTTFNRKKLNLFLIHGWNNNRSSNVNTYIREGIFDGIYDFNVFVVDWSSLANQGYLSAKNSVVGVGQVVGNFINGIQVTYQLTGSSFVLVGHSLGAHVAGSAGATAINKIGNIIGLDPAAALFSLLLPKERLDTSDAELVQVIHTNGRLLGFASSIGHIDYFPNGGMSQPGCGIDLTGSCSHRRAYEYLAEALVRGPVFRGVLCPNNVFFAIGLCTFNSKSVMGQIVYNTDKFGDYFLNTNGEKPYGLS